MHKNRTKLSRMLFLLFVIVIFPTLLLGTLIFRHNASLLEQSIAEVTRQSVLTLCSNLEQHVLDIRTELISLLNQESQKDVRGFLIYQNDFSTHDYYITIRNILSRLNATRSRHDLIEDIEVYYPALSQSISIALGLHPQQDRSAHLEAAAHYPSMLAEVDGRLCVLYATPQVPDRERIQILVVAYLSHEKLAGALSVPPYPDQPTTLLHADSAVAISNHSHARQTYVDNDLLFAADSVILNSRIEKHLCANEVFAVSHRLSQMMFAYLFVGCVMFLLYAFFIHRLVSHPVARLTDGMNRMRQGELSFRISQIPQPEEFARLTDGLNELVEQINELIETNYQQEIDNRIFELKHLQAQISPHFLYNSLYILRHMIDCEDNESAAIMVQHLGDYFHYTASTDKMEISFAQEYEHGKNYLSIQCIRFKGWLVAEYQEVPKSWANLLVPKLIIQPLYENAVHYAIREDGKELLIRTSFAEKDGYGVICVEDSGMALSEEKLAEMQRHLYARTENDNVTALYNIHRRLQLRYGNRCSVNLSQSKLGGLRVELTFSLN